MGPVRSARLNVTDRTRAKRMGSCACMKGEEEVSVFTQRLEIPNTFNTKALRRNEYFLKRAQ